MLVALLTGFAYLRQHQHPDPRQLLLVDVTIASCRCIVRTLSHRPAHHLCLLAEVHSATRQSAHFKIHVGAHECSHCCAVLT